MSKRDQSDELINKIDELILSEIERYKNQRNYPYTEYNTIFRQPIDIKKDIKLAIDELIIKIINKVIKWG